MKAIDGVWVDHEKAVVAVVREDEIRTRTLRSDVPPHPHWAGAQDGGGEKKYEKRIRTRSGCVESTDKMTETQIVAQVRDLAEAPGPV